MKKINYRIGTFGQEMLGKGIRSRLWFRLKKRIITDDFNFVNLHLIKDAFARHGIGKVWVDGKLVNNVAVWPECVCCRIDDSGRTSDRLGEEFLRLSDGHFVTLAKVARLLIGESVVSMIEKDMEGG